MLASQMVWPWEPIASKLEMSTLWEAQNSKAAEAKVSPRWTLISERAEAEVVSCLMRDRTRDLRGAGMGISLWARRVKWRGEEGVAWWKWQRAQSMPSFCEC